MHDLVHLIELDRAEIELLSVSITTRQLYGTVFATLLSPLMLLPVPDRTQMNLVSWDIVRFQILFDLMTDIDLHDSVF